MLSTTVTTALVFYILEVVASTDACMCVPVHPQTAFCKSDFVIRAMVTSERQEKTIKGSEVLKKLGYPVPVFVHYNVEVLHVYKGFSKIANITTGDQETFQVPVHTSPSGAQCGVSLTKGTKYLIMGSIFRNRLQINHCNYVREFDLVTKEIKHGLHGNYDCDCVVSTCVDGYCDFESGCPWNINWSEPADKCTEKHRYCKKQVPTLPNESNLKCVWNNETPEYNRCTETTVVESQHP